MADSQSKDEFDWPPLESNPEVFTEYLQKIGLSKEYSIGEVFGFDEELLAFLPQPIHGIIVTLERLNRESDVAKGLAVDVSKVDYYMDQTGSLDNACGIIACLHAIFNNSDSMLVADSVLENFLVSTKSQTPAERCKSLEKNNDFKNIHKGFAMKGQSAAITTDQSKVQHHFVAYVVKNGQLIELDGTKKGPYVIGECSDVLRGSIKEIQRRLEQGEISDKLSMMTLNSAA
uniref:Ubiquitin carboxyl-terminal hydrolase n=1 Tax=Odontella aurita TaxID=265563 RepID=A0A7S4J079_9STRA|mmetsp:Transcript_34523/g.103204  ORF Transcript_34523/g.103204 Transcript_34523/m.103204 type:complete len:231 (+) Transcript_34523:211-903(+)